MDTQCRVSKCERTVFTKKSGLCQSHYLSARRTGGEPKGVIRRQTSGSDKEKALTELGWTPLEPYPGDKDKKWQVACPKKHEVAIRWGTFGINEEPCKECRHPSLAETHPHLLSWWNHEENGDLSPNAVTKGMDIKIKWKCPVGHSPNVAISSMARKSGPGCGICTGNQVAEGVNAFSRWQQTYFGFGTQKPIRPSPTRFTFGRKKNCTGSALTSTNFKCLHGS